MSDTKPGNDTSVGPSTAGQPSRLKVWKDRLDFLQGIVAIIVLILGGWWFVRQNQASEKLNTAIQLENRLLDGAATKLVEAHIKLSNVGAVPVNLHFVHLIVRQVVPTDPGAAKMLASLAKSRKAAGTEDMWPALIDQPRKSEIFLEPGESDEMDFNFVVPASVKTVQIDANVAREKNSDFSWRQTQLYDLLPPKTSE